MSSRQPTIPALDLIKLIEESVKVSQRYYEVTALPQGRGITPDSAEIKLQELQYAWAIIKPFKSVYEESGIKMSIGSLDPTKEELPENTMGLARFDQGIYDTQILIDEVEDFVEYLSSQGIDTEIVDSDLMFEPEHNCTDKLFVRQMKDGSRYISMVDLYFACTEQINGEMNALNPVIEALSNYFARNLSETLHETIETVTRNSADLCNKVTKNVLLYGANMIHYKGDVCPV